MNKKESILNKNNKINKQTMGEPKFIAKVRITKQGQITVPHEARELLKLEVESDAYWYVIDGNLILTTELENPKELLRKIKKRQ
jgi:bifunctional DNA-binding transcriptional regulator/antitoxin component of YhaV-PrlF toxin-antitoxin module